MIPISRYECNDDARQEREATLYFRSLLGDAWAERLIMAGAVITPATIESVAWERLLEYVRVVRSDLAWNEERERRLLAAWRALNGWEP